MEQIMRLRAMRQQYFSHMRALLDSQGKILTDIEAHSQVLALPLQADGVDAIESGSSS